MASDDCALSHPGAGADRYSPITYQMGEIVLDENKPEKEVFVGSALDPMVRAELITFLKENMSFFSRGKTPFPLLHIDIASILIHNLLKQNSQCCAGKRIGRKTTPIFNKVILDMKIRYPQTKKAVLSLIYVARKLRAYFQRRPIKVLNSLPLKNIIRSLDKIERRLKWAIKLSEFDISFQARTTVKSQALADFRSNS